MKLTPLDIRHKEFRRALRGYSEEEVDIFLDDVADEFDRLFQENIDYQDRIDRLETQVAQFEGLKETLQKTLVSAQQQADEVRANARKEAELILRDADLKVRGIVNESYAVKQRVKQSLIQLKQVEDEFRFKFRSLLEAHLNLLAQDETSEDRRRFERLVTGIEEEESEGTGTSQRADPVFSLAGDGDRPPAQVVPLVPMVDLVPDAGGEPVASGEADREIGDEPAEEALPVETASPAEDPSPRDEQAVREDEQAGPADEGLFGDMEWEEESRASASDGSPVRRFLFGKREKETPEGPDEADREFE